MAISREHERIARQLEYFLSPKVGYQAGVALVYGDDKKALTAFQGVFAGADPERIKLLQHRRPGERAIEIHREPLP